MASRHGVAARRADPNPHRGNRVPAYLTRVSASARRALGRQPRPVPCRRSVAAGARAPSRACNPSSHLLLPLPSPPALLPPSPPPASSLLSSSLAPPPPALTSSLCSPLLAEFSALRKNASPPLSATLVSAPFAFSVPPPPPPTYPISPRLLFPRSSSLSPPLDSVRCRGRHSGRSLSLPGCRRRSSRS